MARGQPEEWFIHLPWVLLGIRTALREDYGVSPAELLYGSALTLPGQFVHPTSSGSPNEFIEKLRATMAATGPTQPCWHGDHATFIPKRLENAQYVFLRVDAKRRSLQRPYTGPHKVLKWGKKYFVIDINGKVDKVSIDRLKVAEIDLKELKRTKDNSRPKIKVLSKATTTTTSGRISKPPERFQSM